MTVIEHNPSDSEILDFVDDSVRLLRESGAAPHAILVGPVAYARLTAAVSHRFNRSEGSFESYGHVPIVVDPGREDYVLVLPAPSASATSVDVVSTA